jgi:hypothetical protein
MLRHFVGVLRGEGLELDARGPLKVFRGDRLRQFRIVVPWTNAAQSIRELAVSAPVIRLATVPGCSAAGATVGIGTRRPAR